MIYSKTCVKQPLPKRPKIGFQDQLSLNACQKYCRMLQGEHSAILLTCVKLPFVIKIFVLSIFEWPFYTGLDTGFPQALEIMENHKKYHAWKNHGFLKTPNSPGKIMKFCEN